MLRALRPLLVGAALTLAGCFVDHPVGASAGETSSTGTSSSTTSASSSSSTTTSATTSVTSATSGDASSGGAGSTRAASSEPSTSGSSGLGSSTAVASDSDPGTTGELLPNPLVIPAEIATCVLLPLDGFPFVGPAGCEVRADMTNATDASGLMLVDTAFNLGGDGREARIYLRFPIPAELAEVSITGLSLALHAADGVNADGPTGDLRRSAPFDLQVLAESAPNPLAPVAPSMIVGVDEVITFDLDPALALPGEPLHLGLWAVSDDGTIFHGRSSTPARWPTLTIDHE